MARHKRSPPAKSAIEKHSRLVSKTDITNFPNASRLSTPLPHKPPKPKKVKPLKTPATIAARAKAREIRGRYHERVNRIRNLAIGPNCQVPCTVIYPTPTEAIDSDDVKLSDIKYEMEDGECKTYWFDGAVGCTHKKNYGVMGAGVSWMENGYARMGRGRGSGACIEFSSGNTRTSRNAELHAMAEALQLEEREVQTDESDMVKRICIFTDLQSLPIQLDPLRADRGSRLQLDPTVPPRFVLQDLFERADWLAERGMAIELALGEGTFWSIRE